jgi:hypothetical protein
VNATVADPGTSFPSDDEGPCDADHRRRARSVDEPATASASPARGPLPRAGDAYAARRPADHARLDWPNDRDDRDDLYC